MSDAEPVADPAVDGGVVAQDDAPAPKAVEPKKTLASTFSLEGTSGDATTESPPPTPVLCEEHVVTVVEESEPASTDNNPAPKDKEAVETSNVAPPSPKPALAVETNNAVSLSPQPALAVETQSRTSINSSQSARQAAIELEKQLTQDKSEDDLEDVPLVEDAAPNTEKVSISRLFQYADGFDKMMMFYGCLFSACHGVFLPCVMLVFGETITLLSGNGQAAAAAAGSNISNLSNITFPDPLDGLVEEMGNQAIIYCGMAAGVIVATQLQVMCWATVGERLTRRIRRLFFSAILNQDMAWFDTHKTGELSSRMSDDLGKVYGGLGDKNGLFFQWMSTHVTGLVIAFVRGWKLTLIVFFGGGPFLAASGVVVSKLIAGIGSKEQDSYAKAGAVAGEVLSSVRTVVAFGGEKQEAERYDKELEEARLFSVKKGFYSGLGFAIVYMLVFFTYALAFYSGTIFVWDGEMRPGDMVTAFFTVVFACFALGHAAPSIQSNAEARGAAVAVYNIIDNVPTINTSSPSGKKPEKVVGDFSFRDVHFSYPSRPDVKILNGLNMDIKSGSTVALVGPSGCGKSTCLQLLQRFYDPDNGIAVLDGEDICNLNVQWLRSQIGIVSQEPVLFHTTIGENIAYGSLGQVSKDDIIAAAKLANAHDFISKFPEGYDTQVGERGAQMSGGQKQRIAIARALIRNPRVLLLDEATSALDTESERVVQHALEAASEGRTTIIIAHRLTTVRNADCIIALKDGVVQEMGNHEQLMKQKGLYHALVNMQGAVNDGDGETKDSNAFPVKETVTKKASDGSKGKVDDASSDKKKEEGATAEEEEDEDLPTIDNMRLLSYNKPEFPSMVLGALGAMAFGVVFPVYGLIFAEVLSVFTLLGNPDNKDEYFRRAHLWSGMFVVLGFSVFIVLTAQHYFFGRSGAALTKRMRSLTFSAILRQDIGFFDEKAHSTGALTTRLSADAALIQGATGAKFGNIFQLLSTLISALAISFAESWEMTLLILLLIPMVGAAGAANTKALAGHGSTSTDEHLEAGKTAVEVIDNVRTVVSLGLEEKSVERYMAILEPAYRKHKRARYIQGFATGMSEGAFFLVYAVTFAFGAFLIQEQRATFNNVFTVFGSMIFGAFSLGQSAAFAPDIAKAAVAAGRVFKLLDKVPTIDSTSEEGEKPDSVKGDIELKSIEFKYPTRPDLQVLNGATITASAGQTIALVGQSGCGKSTSVSLLERFYDPLAGVVSVDGRDIKSLNLAWLRRQIGIVQQEPILFDASIADNIAYGALDSVVTIEQIQEATKKSNIHDFIKSLPDGYDTNVGAKGTQLSGGQKQRIAIARALIRSPKILLLDEATSALDTESEKVVQEALDAARQGRTSIVIAHRLSTIHNSDKIVVLGGGKVLEQGTHNELMAATGAYYKLNCAQESNTGATLA